MKLLILIILNFTIIKSIKLECKFYIKKWDSFYGPNTEDHYCCSAGSSFTITSKDDRSITEVIGTHLPGKTANDVEMFKVLYSTVKYFPLGIEKFFPKVKIVTLNNTKLEEISQEDVRPFGAELISLWLWDNNLKSIDGNLFEFNPNLQKIDLDKNQINYVGHFALSRLKKLNEIYFQFNDCHSEKVVNDSNAALILAKTIESKCNISQSSKILRKIEESKNELKNKSDDIKSQIMKMQLKMKEMSQIFGKNDFFND